MTAAFQQLEPGSDPPYARSLPARPSGTGGGGRYRGAGRVDGEAADKDKEDAEDAEAVAGGCAYRHVEDVLERDEDAHLHLLKRGV